jgi:hypothetical protein
MLAVDLLVREIVIGCPGGPWMMYVVITGG